MAIEFDEKEYQIEPGSFISFGIPISSRYAKASEIIQMINFTRLLFEINKDLDEPFDYVESLFYDSTAGICNINLKATANPYDLVGSAIRELALQSIRCFEWDGQALSCEPVIF